METKVQKTKIAAHYDKFTKTMHWVITNRLSMSVQMSDGQFVVTMTNKKMLIDRAKDFKKVRLDKSIDMMSSQESGKMDPRLTQDIVGFIKIVMEKTPKISYKQSTKKLKQNKK